MRKWSDKMVLEYYVAWPKTTMGRISEMSNRDICDLLDLFKANL